METTGRKIDLKTAVEEGRAFIVEQPIEWKQAEANEDGDTATDLPIRTLISTPSLDLHGHIVKPSAFEETLAGNFKDRPLMLAFHDFARPIGLWPKSEITKEGVWLEGAITGATNDGREMQELVMAGIVNGSSIGWWPKEDGLEFDEETDALIVSDLTLFEGSLVPLPSNSDTFVEITNAWCDRWVKSYRKTHPKIAPRLARASGGATAARTVPTEALDALANLGSGIDDLARGRQSKRATIGASVEALKSAGSGGRDTR